MRGCLRLYTDSLVALVGLTVAGLGISYLPRQCFEPLVTEGKLTIIQTTPALPPVTLVANSFRNGHAIF
jgi:DNA-binding transcriptional LysR family regulator